MGFSNYHLRSKDMRKAGKFALKNLAAVGATSFGTAGTNGERWDLFCDFAKAEKVRWLEQITPELVQAYGRTLAEAVHNEELAASTAQNRVSAVNSVMRAATQGQWTSVSPVQDCGISQRSAIRRSTPHTLDRDTYNRGVEAVRLTLGDRGVALLGLCREFGLRSKEASLLDARSALEEALDLQRVTIDLGTKGGRERTLEIQEDRQIEALEQAAAIQGDNRSIMPEDANWVTWRQGELRDIRETLSAATGDGLHDLRAAYACERYTDLTAQAAPVTGAVIEDRAADAKARETIAEELGHGRIDVVSAYIGGRR